jgi:hypothetical protein
MGALNDGEIKAVVEKGFANLQEWLDNRLKRQQEELLMHLNESPGNRYSPGCNGVYYHDVDTSVPRSVSFSSPAASATRPEFVMPPLPGAIGRNAPTLEVRSAWQDQDTEIVIVSPGSGKSGRDKVRDTSFANKVGAENDQEWQTKLMDVFDQLDLDGSGSIDRNELVEVCLEIGFPEMEAFDLFKKLDRTQNGTVDRVEWLHIVDDAKNNCDDSELELLAKFVNELSQRQNDIGRIYKQNHRRQPILILRHDYPFRMAWDICMMLLLLYISVSLPFAMGFGQSEVLDQVDMVFDFIFCFDVLLNFRTSYADREESIITDGRKIAFNYLRTWFLLDFFSSVPFEIVSAGFLPNLTPARLLKMGKIAKVLKLLRMSKMVKIFQGSELIEKLEEKSTSKFHQTLGRLAWLLVVAFLLCHWMACFMAASEGSIVQAADSSDMSSRYLLCMYWAMTTLSTVGYGDVTPSTDMGRGYAMLAMIVGGAFYGYIVGCVTSVISDMDLNQRAYFERLDLITSWLDGHYEIPKILRRRIRKHFRDALAARTAIDDPEVISELSPELRADTAFFHHS